MKKNTIRLLVKTSRYYLALSAGVFLITGLVFYLLLHRIFYSQLDQGLLSEKMLIEEAINYSDSVPDFRTIFGHLVDVTILYDPNQRSDRIHDTVMYNNEEGKFLSYRHLFAENTSFRNKGYTINIYKPLLETEKLIAWILVVVALLFITLLLLLVVVNYTISRRVWIPFYRTLTLLENFDVNREKPLPVNDSDIFEFDRLNQALTRMSDKIQRDFLNLKEFNENAAHELQTPLAVIKSKLELLIQDERLDEEQLKTISVIFEATTRITKLNQGLLLISRIDNEQFTGQEPVLLAPLIRKFLDHFGELTEMKKIKVSATLDETVSVRMNPALAEILVSNLISNAIRHNLSAGTLEIVLNAAQLSVTNTGKPLTCPPEQLFQRFRKSDPSGDSVGLGLAIVHKIAALSKITIAYQTDGNLHTLLLNFF